MTEIDGRGHPLHPRPVAARGRAAADHDPRLARLGHRAARVDRAADRPDGARRNAPRTRSTSCCRRCPGYGFSGRAGGARLGLGPHAQAWAELMRRLGYNRYVAQGGDVGAAVTDAMGRQAPEGLVGIHTELLSSFPPTCWRRSSAPTRTDSQARGSRLTAEPRRNARHSPGSSRLQSGYFLEQATRPQTIGYGLLDSPVALAAWMLDHDTDSYDKISRAFVDGQARRQPHPRSRPRQRHAVLADGHRRVGGAVVLGERTEHGRRSRPAQKPAAATLPVGFTVFPGEIFEGAAQLGREGLSEPHLLQRGRQGRPLRRLGGAAALQRGAARGVQVTALTRRSS